MEQQILLHCMYLIQYNGSCTTAQGFQKYSLKCRDCPVCYPGRLKPEIKIEKAQEIIDSATEEELVDLYKLLIKGD